VIANGPVAGTLVLDISAGNATLTNPSNRLANLSITNANDVSVVNGKSLVLGAANVRTLLAQTLAGDLALNGAIHASGGSDSIVLASAHDFYNTGGTLDPGTGRWLVYSNDPAANLLGGLTSDFKHYNCKYATGCQIPTTGNGLLYILAPVLGISANPVTIMYGESGPALTYSITGLVDGDTSATALTGALTRTTGVLSGSGHEGVGTYLMSQGSVGTTLGYQLSFTGADYTITRRPLNLTAYAPNKIYDGTIAASVTLTDDHIAGDSLTTTFTNATFADRNVGSDKTVTVNDVGMLGADVGNYTLQLPLATTADITYRVPDGYTGAITSVSQMENPCVQYAQGGGNSSHCETSFQHADGLEQLPVAIAESGIRLPAGVALTFSY
jgi:hypothetical protein